MRVWRICRLPFADLSGDGAKRYGGRWNSAGAPMVYTAESVALAALEMRVHLDLPPELTPLDYVLMAIEAPDATVEKMADLPVDPASLGDAWLASRRTLALRVPSFVVPHSSNVLLNPLHPEIGSVSVTGIEPFSFDLRLWLPLTP